MTARMMQRKISTQRTQPSINENRRTPRRIQIKRVIPRVSRKASVVGFSDLVIVV
jgi:hypothetical protein